MVFDGFDGKHLPTKAIKKHQRHRRLTLGSDPLLPTENPRLSQQGLTLMLSTHLLSGRYIVPKLIVALCHREQLLTFNYKLFSLAQHLVDDGIDVGDVDLAVVCDVCWLADSLAQHIIGHLIDIGDVN